MSVRIITDSASDISQAEAKQLGIDVLPLKTIFGEEEYLDGVTLDHAAFYKKLVESGVFPSTSQIAPSEYEEKFRAAVENGDDVVCITISSKLSGCYQSANIAAKEFPGRIVVVDSLTATAGERLLVQLALRAAAAGQSAQEIGRMLNEQKPHIRIYALVDTLEYLKKGGRISSTTAFVGSLLSIKPIISVENGEVATAGKARGTKNGNQMLMELVEKSGGIDTGMPACLVYTGLDNTLLQKFVADSEALYAGMTGQPPIHAIGSTIGTHVGPGAYGLVYFVKK